ncbi:MAG: PRC-barrel domain-containing protein [Rhodospirillales bacterium]|nr:PRC-barrel domain-containing protein [Rhodospirillales bacterium]
MDSDDPVNTTEVTVNEKPAVAAVSAAPGEDDALADNLVRLGRSDLLKGTPVFSTGGQRLGTLTGVVVQRASGRVASVVLRRSRLFGLLRRQIVLPREILSAPLAGGGFVIPWPLPDVRSLARQGRPAGRLDPARGE